MPAFDETAYLVLDNFGALGHVYRETNEGEDLAAIIEGLITGQYNKPLRVITFNAAEGWSRDISEDVGREILIRVANEGHSLPSSTRDFVSLHAGEHNTRRAEISVSKSAA